MTHYEYCTGYLLHTGIGHANVTFFILFVYFFFSLNYPIIDFGIFEYPQMKHWI